MVKPSSVHHDRLNTEVATLKTQTQTLKALLGRIGLTHLRIRALRLQLEPRGGEGESQKIDALRVFRDRGGQGLAVDGGSKMIPSAVAVGEEGEGLMMSRTGVSARMQSEEGEQHRRAQGGVSELAQGRQLSGPEGPGGGRATLSPSEEGELLDELAMDSLDTGIPTDQSEESESLEDPVNVSSSTSGASPSPSETKKLQRILSEILDSHSPNERAVSFEDSRKTAAHLITKSRHERQLEWAAKGYPHICGRAEDREQNTGRADGVDEFGRSEDLRATFRRECRGM
ncbi:hypothetical protein MMC28_006214 [Mycoblastus sanguinarius]|nr:hypothetical protein [Mycoblastus sanguinarius]